MLNDDSGAPYRLIQIEPTPAPTKPTFSTKDQDNANTLTQITESRLLKKEIYGHPKSSRLWAACLHRKLLEMGYEQFLTDQCVYGKWTNWDTSNIHGQTVPDNMSFVFLLIHSDDIIIISHNAHIMNAAKVGLLKAFDGTDNGNLTSFCGVEIKITDNQISLSMEYYWRKLMEKFNVPENEVDDSPIKTKILRSECPTVPDPIIKNNYGFRS